MLEALVAIAAGILAGMIAGLAPGIHTNMASVLVVSLSPLLLNYASVTSLCCFIIAMSVTQAFFDCIPSIFLGAPEEDTALGVLPGHRYLIRGYGLMAVKLSVIGCLGGLLVSILLFPLFIPIVKYGYPLIQRYIGYLLLAVVIFMILRDRHKIWAVSVFLLSGVFGIVVFGAGIKDPLFPMLSGLFGVSTMIISLSESQSIPPQKKSQIIKLKKITTIKAVLSGQFSGFITATMPGLGASTAAVISMQTTRKLGDNGFMILMGAISVANFVLSMVTLLVLDKARNGSIIAVQTLAGSITFEQIVLLLSVALATGGVSAVLALYTGKIFSQIVSIVNYRVLVIGIIAFITILVVILTGWKGLLILATGTAIGIIPAKVKVTRTHAMGCLLVPVIIYFI